ncbi:MAG: DMT family transporter [Desulfosporosinus sp.]|nr:DMT family transporter [Desulfosporosinus sp.]
MESFLGHLDGDLWNYYHDHYWYANFFEGIKRIGATSASIISTSEPVMTVVLAVIIFNEYLTPLQAVGGFSLSWEEF